MSHQALLYDVLDEKRVQCNLCSHRCLIRNHSRGICQVRENRDGELCTLVYGNLISRHVDPIEKKPLYHFLPGSKSYSIATPGCNFHCEWCQNWQISQMPRIMQMPHRKRVPPERIVEAALAAGCQSIAYTYTEPTVFFEYSYDVARLAHDAGLKNIYVTNGYMTPEMLEMMGSYLDAANVDIKAFSDETYRKLIGGHLTPVLESCQKMKSLGIWVEITTLIVPGINDELEELKAIAEFIYESLGSDTPWHISRFYPQYRMLDRNPTNESNLLETREMGQSLGIKYIYLGNMAGINDTTCKDCGEVLISRAGYSTKVVGINHEGLCHKCGAEFDGVLMPSML